MSEFVMDKHKTIEPTPGHIAVLGDSDSDRFNAGAGLASIGVVTAIGDAKRKAAGQVLETLQVGDHVFYPSDVGWIIAVDGNKTTKIFREDQILAKRVT